MKILLATNNAHKAEEIRAILSGFPELEICTLSEVGLEIPEPEEDGRTLEENAYIKAREIHDSAGLAVIADDTGLEVASLNGAPGVISARYAGENATYEDNCTALLAALANAGSSSRSARFRTVICYVDDLRTLFSEGVVDGVITAEPRGGKGFGYDPIFQPDGFDTTFAQMTSGEKNAISHRGHALRNFNDVFGPYVSDDGEG